MRGTMAAIRSVGRAIRHVLSWVILLPLVRRLWRWAGEVDERRAAERAANEAAKAAAAGMTVEEYRWYLEDERRVAKERRKQERADEAARKGDPYYEERVALRVELAELERERARIETLAKTNYSDANKQAGLLLPRAERANRRLERLNAATVLFGACPRCSAKAELFQGGRYFRCGMCGARGRWDIYQR